MNMTLDDLKKKLDIVSRSNEKEIEPETATELATSLMVEFISQLDSGFGVYWDGLSFNKLNKSRPQPKQTPLPIPDELWKCIKPEFKYIAMNKHGEQLLFKNEPYIHGHGWANDDEGGELFCYEVLTISVENIYWKLSLTKRPEGLDEQNTD